MGFDFLIGVVGVDGLGWYVFEYYGVCVNDGVFVDYYVWVDEVFGCDLYVVLDYDGVGG